MKTLEEMGIRKGISKVLYESPLKYTWGDVEVLEKFIASSIRACLAEIIPEVPDVNYDNPQTSLSAYQYTYWQKLQANIKTFFGEEKQSGKEK